MTSRVPLKVQAAERGWPGHFILGNRCAWHRNTLLEVTHDGEPTRRVVVSSVARLQSRDFSREMSIAINRAMETMCFVACWSEPYWEADIDRQLSSPLVWSSALNDRAATLVYEEIHQDHVRHWVTVMTEADIPTWVELGRRRD